MTELEVATRVVCVFLTEGKTIESFNDLFEINSGNKEVLKSHIDALKSIFEKASAELERSIEGAQE